MGGVTWRTAKDPGRETWRQRQNWVKGQLWTPVTEAHILPWPLQNKVLNWKCSKFLSSSAAAKFPRSPAPIGIQQNVGDAFPYPPGINRDPAGHLTGSSEALPLCSWLHLSVGSIRPVRVLVSAAYWLCVTLDNLYTSAPLSLEVREIAPAGKIGRSELMYFFFLFFFTDNVRLITRILLPLAPFLSSS